MITLSIIHIMSNTSRPKTFYWIRTKSLMRTRRELLKTLKNLIGAKREKYLFLTTPLNIHRVRRVVKISTPGCKQQTLLALRHISPQRRATASAEHFTRLLHQIYDGSRMAGTNELTICFGIRLHLFTTITLEHT